MKKLEDLQIGDEVVLEHATYKMICNVVKTTKLYVGVEKCSRTILYKKKDGKPKGLSGFGVSRIVVATDELKAEVKEFSRRNKYRNIIRACNMDKLSTDKLEQIYNIIKSEEK